MPKISDIIRALEAAAPPRLQEDYDNTGLQIGDVDRECTGVLLALDVIPEVVAEAADRGCNLLVSHHPLLFRGLKRIAGSTKVEQSVRVAIERGVTVYSLHTAVDNAPGGVSHEMARRLGIHNARTLERMSHKLLKLTTFVPTDHADRVCEALFRAGCGRQGNYDSCSWSVRGQGSFRPLEGATPFVGSYGRTHYEEEVRIEVLLPLWLLRKAEQALIDAHPYEHPAYEFVMIENEARDYGSGVIGELESPMTGAELVERVKETFGSPVVRCTAPPEEPIVRVAMCGGSGSSFIPGAIGQGAQAYITSDTSYHNFVDYTGRLFIIDIGHYESEHCTEEIFHRLITERFPGFAVRYSQTERNPIFYL